MAYFLVVAVNALGKRFELAQFDKKSDAIEFASDYFCDLRKKLSIAESIVIQVETENKIIYKCDSNIK